MTGVVLGVGVHPIDDPSPLMRVLRGDGESGLALALRSSTRAVPVLALGLGLGIAWWSRSCPPGAARPPTRRRGAVASAGPVACRGARSPPPGCWSWPSSTSRRCTTTRLVDPALERDEQPPAAWTDAAAALDAAPPGYRVLQLPGAEFGAFRWGYTVDPPLPGADRQAARHPRPAAPRQRRRDGPRCTRSTTASRPAWPRPAAIAPVARLLGADTIWLPGDAAFDRFRTPRPEITHALFAAAAAATEGLGMPVPYGPPAPNPPNVPMVDEQSLSDPRVGQPVPPVELVPVQDPEAVIRAKDRSVLIAAPATASSTAPRPGCSTAAS